MSTIISTPATKTAEERLGVILSNQYSRRMHRNRPKWYEGRPLDTAPKVFSSWRRNDVPLIRDWEACYRVVAKKAAWMSKIFANKYYEINGVIWGWDDPASKFLVDLFTGAMETVEFAISADAFLAPHIVVTHSPGDEPEYLDSLGNPDQLTQQPRRNTPCRNVPIPEGYTPRQHRLGPTGMEQLFLPPRLHMIIEREEWAIQCADATVSRYRSIQRLSIQFHNGLDRVRTRHQFFKAMGGDVRGRDTSPKAIAGSCQEERDFVPMTEDELSYGGWSDADAASSLLRRGIMFQMSLGDLAEMADSAILSDDEDEDEEASGSALTPIPSIAEDTYGALRKLGMIFEDDEDDEDDEEGEVDKDDAEDREGAEDERDEGRLSSPPLAHSLTIASDTYAALRKLGMIFEEDEEGDDEESDEEDEEGESGDEVDDEDIGESESEGEEQNAFESVPCLGTPDFKATPPEPAAFPPSKGSLDLASMLSEERSSVSSLSEDQDSAMSGCESPDTEDCYGC